MEEREKAVQFLQELDEGRKKAEEVLSAQLGFKVRLDRVANEIRVLRVVETAVPIASVREHELLASGIQHLMDACTAVIPYPEFVSLNREYAKANSEFHMTFPVYDRNGKVASLNTLVTFSSSKGFDLRIARNELADYLRRTGVGKTLVVLNDFKEWKDSITNECQVWADGALVEGLVAWNPETKRLEER